MKRFLLLLVLGMTTFAAIGCDVDGKVDDDGAKIKVDVDK